MKKEQIHFIFDHNDIIPFLNSKEEHIVTNIDHHHDLGYPHPETQQEELNCGNWVNYVPNLKKYFWIKNPNSIPKEQEEISTADILNYNLNILTIPDELYICFSIPWVPPCNQHLFYLWMDMLNHIYDTHFDFERKE